MKTIFNHNVDETAKQPAHPQHSATTPPVTPTAMTTSAHQMFIEMQSIYDELSTLPSLAPSEQVNSRLTHLVNLCILPHSTNLMSHFSSILGVEMLCEHLRPLCAEAEGELERHWARRMIESAVEAQSTVSLTSGVYKKPVDGTLELNCDTHELLRAFPYYQNYIDLCRLECSTLEAFLPCSTSAPTKIAFIGSGPLPLTSLCVLDRYPDATAHNIDRDASALEISQELCEKLGYGPRMSFAQEDVSLNDGKEKTDWRSFLVVFLAALVGMDTPSKLAILSSLARKLQPGTLVVTRSAKGMRSVLYPVLELTDDIERIGYEVLVETHPWTKVVNSVIVLRVKKR
ncbi:Nn.00g011720.m01.CDS01 [Neocucurbitaria sp. VM-36]